MAGIRTWCLQNVTTTATPTKDYLCRSCSVLYLTNYEFRIDLAWQVLPEWPGGLLRKVVRISFFQFELNQIAESVCISALQAKHPKTFTRIIFSSRTSTILNLKDIWMEIHKFWRAKIINESILSLNFPILHFIFSPWHHSSYPLTKFINYQHA